MKGDFTRNTFDPRKHYSSVLMQQGRVQLDTDWNEQADIQSHRRRTAVRDLVGLCGGPKGKDSQGQDLAGFKVIAEQNQLRITKGRYYVDGILCENESDLLVKKTGGQTPTPGIASAFYPPDGLHLVYLDVWERHVTSLEDSKIREIALGGPDTATRAQVVWEVKIAKDVAPSGSSPDCESFAGWLPPGQPSTGRMKARIKRADTQTGPCDVPAGEVHRLENQLYRVEVHKGGNVNTATFKWSRDNGTVVAAWGKASGDGKELTLKDATPQQLQGFDGKLWIEVTDDIHELQGKRGVLAQLLEVEGNVLTIDPNTVQDPDDPTATSIDPTKFTLNPKVRRWDSEAAITLQGPASQQGWVELEEDIQVFFDPQGKYETGDYWLIPSRTLVDSLLWPIDENDKAEYEQKHGVEHHYCPLALVSVSGGQVQVKDCRKFFPPATAITADDVFFDSQTCEMQGVETVQEAIDTLCQRDGGACTLVALPGAGWEKVFDRIPQGQDAHICFQVGDYPYAGEQPVTIKDKGAIHVKITGCGPGTRIVAQKSESALSFVGCESVTVRDLYAESKAAGQAGKMRHLNGVLSFVDVPQVTVENTTLKCRPGTRRMATCITVRNSEGALRGRAQHANVRIRHNDLLIGHLQTGVLLVNTARVQVEDNTLAVVKKPAWLTLDRMLRDNIYRSAVRRTLVSNLMVAEATNPTSPSGGGNPISSFNVGNFEVGFEANEAVSGELSNVILAHMAQPESLHTSTELIAHLNVTLDNILRRPDVIAESPALNNWFKGLKKQNPAVASQGIVVGGRKAEDVRILNNTIHGVLQGIHVGQSRKLKDRDPNVLDRTVRLQIIGNTVTVLLPTIIPYERHGIFCGNCDSLAVENNYVVIKRYQETLETNIDGIRVFGTVGRMVKVCQNHIEYPTVGIYFNPLNTPIGSIPASLWIFGENMVVDPLSGEALEVGDRPQKDETSAEKSRRKKRNQKKRQKVTTYRNWP